MYRLLVIFCCSSICLGQSLDMTGVDNLHKVNEKIYRSGQPTKEGFSNLDSLGVKVVLSLRNRVSDNSKLKHTNIRTTRVRINTWRMNEKHILKALQIIQKEDAPILVHCLHGADRTGVVIASYRMVFQGWSKEKAIAEFLSSQYGYHAGWFPRLLRLVEELDVDQLKQELGQ